MKRKLTVVLLIVALLLSVSVQIASAGNDDGMVTVKQFVVSNMPEPNVIHYFNKVIDLGNGLKGEMLIGKGEKTYLDVWKPNSGKRDLYKWNGSQWVYLHSITDIVPGFEKPMTINTYKYATWDEYTHTVPTDDNPTPNPNPPSDGLTVTLSGPAKLSVSQKGKYTATVRGGTPPYTLTWSSNGYVSSENYDAYYRWSKEGKYTVTVAVRDLNGQTATASMDVQVVDWKVIVEAPVNSTWYFDGYNENGGNAAGKIYSDPENAKYGVEVVDGNDVSDFEVEDIAVYNSDNTIHIDANKFKKKGTGDVTAEWLMGLSDIVGKIQFPVGDVTINAKVKQISTNRVKEASKKVHISFAVPVNPNVSVKWINHTKPEKVQWYTYTLVVIDTVTKKMYFKKVSSDTNYTTDEALKKAYDGGDPNLTKEKEDFISNAENNNDGEKPNEGNADPWKETSVGKNLVVDPTEDYNYVNKGDDGFGGHVSVINSDGTTTPAKTASSAGVAAISEKIKGDFNNRDNNINAVFSSGGTIEQGMSIVSVDPYPIVISTNPESSLHDGNFVDITKDVEIKVQLYKGFTAVVKDQYGNKYSVDFELDQSKPPQSLFPDVPGKPFMVTALVKYVNRINQLPVFTKQDSGNRNDPVTVYTTSDQKVNDVTGISNHSYSYVEDKDSSKIIGITSNPSSVNLIDLKFYKTTVLYYEKSGLKVTPSGEQNGIVKDNSGDIIAAYFRNNMFLYIMPIKKGNGVIHLTKDDLGGPYGIDVPINVNVDAPPFSISVNGTNWDSLDNFGWLIPEPTNNDNSGGGTGIDNGDSTGDTNNTYYCYGVWGNTRKRLDRTGERGNSWSNLRPYSLNVSTSTSNGIYIRVTVKYGDSPALVVTTSPQSSKDVNMVSSMDWINSNLDAVASGNTQEVVQSANYVIDISFNGSDWFTLKQGTDVIHFERDSDVGG